MRAFAVATCGALLGVSTLAAQQQWMGPQPPCDIKPGFFRINSVIVDLQKAVQTPALRERMLSQAQDVLVRTIRDDKQDKNPAAWYYLGRYYVETKDAAGADTAFDRAEELAPQCKTDIAGYRGQLAEAATNAGLTLWQGGNADSGAVLLRQAYAVDPTKPKPLFQLGNLYAERNQLDSAAAILGRAAAAAGSDPAYADAKREALLTVARLAQRNLQANPAVQKWQHSRYSRDSLAPYLAADSGVLARMQQSSASRRARGARLSPADQQAFTRDSTTRADVVARGRALRETLQQQAAVDSATAQAAFDPAVAAYRGLVAAYPTNVEAATSLAGIYAQAGRRAEAASVFDDLLAHSSDLTTSDLYDLGQRLLQAKLLGPGTKAYALALQRNPYHRNALAELASAYIDARDTANALATAQRLQALDPLNKAALHIVAQAWELRGRRDSAQVYGTLADTLTVDISIASLVGDSAGVTLTGVASNLGNGPSKALRVTVDLLDARGTAVTSQAVDVPALPPGGSQQFQVKGAGRGIVGWRYRAG
ncbi:MAG TPA: tetratricopeptide repeat protein [Gemmatimonadales bacterium]|nr:tetratricopeptide repeat protein [Gemmatimonadales bacterium]